MLTHTSWNLLSDSGISSKEDYASKGFQPPRSSARISRVPVQTLNENMCNPGSIEESPNVQVTSLGNNSFCKSLHETLKDSVQTHLTLNIAGGTKVRILLIIAISMIIMLLYSSNIIKQELRGAIQAADDKQLVKDLSFKQTIEFFQPKYSSESAVPRLINPLFDMKPCQTERQ